jgi:nucleoside-diphosphate-sugar epimerase
MTMTDRTFLITGATGFLGGAVTVAALRAGYGRQLRLLARGSIEGSPQLRLLTNLRRLGATELELKTLGEDFVLEADLARDGAIKGHPQLRSVERVIHAALRLKTPWPPTSYRSAAGCKVLETMENTHPTRHRSRPAGRRRYRP